MGASVNLFMWHGGTNFGLSSDYNTAPSYDYDAPVSECGDLKLNKYWTVRNVTQEFFGSNKLPEPSPIKKLTGKRILMEAKRRLVDDLNHDNLLVKSKFPYKMEEIGYLESILAYRHKLSKTLKNAKLRISGVHDRAYVVVDDKFVDVITRDSDKVVKLSGKHEIVIFCENMGHIAWFAGGLDAYENQYKGIGNVTVDRKILENWEHHKIDINLLRYSDIHTNDTTEQGLIKHGPTVYSGTLHLTQSELLDTFLDTTGWGKGYLVVNGHLICQYWPAVGPQYTLYLPGVYLRKGENKITMLELQSEGKDRVVRLTSTHLIDGPIKHDVFET